MRTFGTLNGCRTRPLAAWWASLRRAAAVVDVLGIQERESADARRAVRRLRRTRLWAGYVPTGSAGALAIVWRTDRFRRMWRHYGKRRTHGGMMHVSSARWFIWQGLQDRETGARVLVVDTHAVNNYAKNTLANQHWRDQAARDHWQAVRAFLERQEASGRWDAIIVLGDFNATLENRAQPFYPGVELAGVCRFDPAPGSIDRIITTRRSSAKLRRRWSVRVWSDHRLHLARYSITRSRSRARQSASRPKASART